MKGTCRTCNEEKDRVHDGYSKCGKNIKIFKDLNGSRWNGNRCPQCVSKNMAKRNQVKKYVQGAMR